MTRSAYCPSPRFFDVLDVHLFLTSPSFVVKMAVLATTRVNLLPTARALANGVPAAVGLKTALPLQFDHGHGHGGARGDRVPKFVGTDNGIISQTRLNGGSCSLLGRGGDRTDMLGNGENNDVGFTIVTGLRWPIWTMR